MECAYFVKERKTDDMVYWDRKHEIAVKELDAISWAAKKAGVSYGSFVSGMKPEQHTEVMEDFCAELLRRKKEEQARLLRHTQEKKSRKTATTREPNHKGKYL